MTRSGVGYKKGEVFIDSSPFFLPFLVSVPQWAVVS